MHAIILYTLRLYDNYHFIYNYPIKYKIMDGGDKPQLQCNWDKLIWPLKQLRILLL